MVAVLVRQYIMVGENQRLLERVADQALRDTLTGLANRELFHDRLTHAMQLHQRDNQSVAVLSMDLDDFKLVNDSLGHPAGDALLVQAAERLLGCVRTCDTVARVGGDEFAVLMEGLPEHSRLVAHRVVAAFEEPFLIDGQQLLMRPSVGLAVASAEARTFPPTLCSNRPTWRCIRPNVREPAACTPSPRTCPWPIQTSSVWPAEPAPERQR